MKGASLGLPEEEVIKHVEMQAFVVFGKALTQNLPLLAYIQKAKYLWHIHISSLQFCT